MVAVSTLSWEEISAPDFGNPARLAWREAVAEIADKAKATLPQCNGRVDSAVKMVLAGDVELLADGKAKVASQSNGQTTYFVVNGTCECRDFPKAEGGWCKHRIAAGMQKRATALAKHKLAQLDAGTNGQTPPASHEAPAGETQVWRRTTPPAPAPLPEAPASVNVRLMIDGRDVQLTLRDTDEARVLARLDAVLRHYPAEVASPAEVAASPPAVAGAAQPTPEGWCVRHGRQLERQSNARGSWWSHQTAAGWCKGR